MSRPRGAFGDVRQALLMAARELYQQRQAMTPATQLGQPIGATWRELAARSAVGFAAAKVAVRNMVRAGDLVGVGRERVGHACRPMVVLAPADLVPGKPGEGTDLAEAIRAWASR